MKSAKPTGFSEYAGHLMIAISRVLRERTRDRLAALHLDPAHIGVLAVLQDGTNVSQRELGRLLRTDRTTIVRLIDELESMGLVERQAGLDRRVNSVQVTASGSKRMNDADFAVRAAQAEVFAPLSVLEQKKLVALLHRVHQGLPAFED